MNRSIAFIFTARICRKRMKNNIRLPEFEQNTSAKRFDLAEMISQMPADYQASEEDFGAPVGKEEW